MESAGTENGGIGRTRKQGKKRSKAEARRTALREEVSTHVDNHPLTVEREATLVEQHRFHLDALGRLERVDDK